MRASIYSISCCHTDPSCPWLTVSLRFSVCVISYLCDLQHLRVEPVEVEHELGQTYERQLDGEHLPEGPVVGGVGEGVEGPLLQHAARHHVALHLLQDVTQDLGGEAKCVAVAELSSHSHCFY